MTQDHAGQPDLTRPEGPAAVVEWGGDARPEGRIARRWAGLRADRRLAPSVAGLAALLLLGSLLSEWRVWTLGMGLEEGAIAEQVLRSGVVGFPTIGTAYLVGLFALAGSTMLTFGGTGAIRRNARLVGLAVTGVLVALLITAATSLDQLGGGWEQITLPRQSDSTGGAEGAEGLQSRIEYGRGFHLAFAGVATIALALFLAAPGRRRGPARPADGTREMEAGDGGEPAPTAWAPEEGGDDWPWSARGSRPAPPPSGPVDLTVEAAPPFLSPGDVDGPR